MPPPLILFPIKKVNKEISQPLSERVGVIKKKARKEDIYVKRTRNMKRQKTVESVRE